MTGMEKSETYGWNITRSRHGWLMTEAIIGFESEDDYFDWRLENDPHFRTAIETSLQQAADGKLTSLRDLRRELGL